MFPKPSSPPHKSPATLAICTHTTPPATCTYHPHHCTRTCTYHPHHRTRHPHPKHPTPAPLHLRPAPSPCTLAPTSKHLRTYVDSLWRPKATETVQIEYVPEALLPTPQKPRNPCYAPTPPHPPPAPTTRTTAPAPAPATRTAAPATRTYHPHPTHPTPAPLHLRPAPNPCTPATTTRTLPTHYVRSVCIETEQSKALD